MRRRLVRARAGPARRPRHRRRRQRDAGRRGAAAVGRRRPRHRVPLPERQRAERDRGRRLRPDRRVDGPDERRGLPRRDSRGTSCARARRRALRQHHPSLLLGAGLRLGARQGEEAAALRGRSLLRAHRVGGSHHAGVPRPDAPPSSSARGLHEGRDRRRFRAAGVSGADGDRGGAEGIGEVPADDARAVLPVHALAEDAQR